MKLVTGRDIFDRMATALGKARAPSHFELPKHEFEALAAHLGMTCRFADDDERTVTRVFGLLVKVVPE